MAPPGPRIIRQERSDFYRPTWTGNTSPMTALRGVGPAADQSPRSRSSIRAAKQRWLLTTKAPLRDGSRLAFHGLWASDATLRNEAGEGE